MAYRDQISICICTYKRPDLLRRLLSRLREQKTEGLFAYSIVIVDNDSEKSAQSVVESYASQSKIPVKYYVEPEQNIALARNRAVKNATGDFIAFIDDDEFPNADWLLNLYEALNRYKADGILAPVLPHFGIKPPNWVLKGQFFDRPSYPTGHVLEWKSTRTGNALLRRNLFKEDRKWFDPTFGSGGEDRDFFRRKIKEGYSFLWCNEAPVFETVPRQRWKRRILLKRALLRGRVALNASRSRPKTVLKSTVAITIYTACLPLFFLIGQHIFMKYLIKDCDHVGKVFGFFGINLVKEKYVTG